MSILDILNEISKIGSSTKKLAILKKHIDNETLKNVFRLAYNNRIVFGIKKIPTELQVYRGVISLELALQTLEEQFATRQLTGNAAVDKLTEMMSMLNEQDREVLRRVILRDLECGASEGSATKVWGKNLIPSQPCMLAQAYSEKAVAKIKFPAVVQLKEDGTRCMIIKHNGIARAWSRNGKEFTDLPIIKSIEECTAIDNCVLDGELILVNNGIVDRQTGNGIVSKAMKGTITAKEAEMVNFRVWDFIEVDSYYAGVDHEVYWNRLDKATLAIEAIADSRIAIVETHVVINIKEARKIYLDYTSRGLEGIILKNMKGIWEDKRSANQVKFKEVIDIDMIIVAAYEHEKDPSKLGGFTVRSKCGLIECNVGSGFTDTTHDKIGETPDGESIWKYIPLEKRGPLDREKIMSDAESYFGLVAELECNGVLARKNPKPGEAPYKLFLPIMCKIRQDKNAEHANTFEEIFG